MACFRPRDAYRSLTPHSGDGRAIVFYPKSGIEYLKLRVPCGQCFGCRLDRSRSWAIRCVHEASLYDQNCFITLTFDDKYLNPKRSLVKRDFVLFMKRLRRYVAPRVATSCFVGSSGRLKIVNSYKPWGVRFFHCGEYGSKFARPHHHACLFNFDFPDKYLWRERDGVKLYRSPILESLWSDVVSRERFGYCTIGDVTFESAAYVARYIMKKRFGTASVGHYDGREPEYITMSRGGRDGRGIAYDWYSRNKHDLKYNDFVIHKGSRCAVPKYYNVQRKLDFPVEYDNLYRERVARGRADPDNTLERLAVREVVSRARCAVLEREYEGGCQ